MPHGLCMRHETNNHNYGCRIRKPVPKTGCTESPRPDICSMDARPSGSDLLNSLRELKYLHRQLDAQGIQHAGINHDGEVFLP